MNIVIELTFVWFAEDLDTNAEEKGVWLFIYNNIIKFGRIQKATLKQRLYSMCDWTDNIKTMKRKLPHF